MRATAVGYSFTRCPLGANPRSDMSHSGHSSLLHSGCFWDTLYFLFFCWNGWMGWMGREV